MIVLKIFTFIFYNIDNDPIGIEIYVIIIAIILFIILYSLLLYYILYYVRSLPLFNSTLYILYLEPYIIFEFYIKLFSISLSYLVSEISAWNDQNFPTYMTFHIKRSPPHLPPCLETHKARFTSLPA